TIFQKYSGARKQPLHGLAIRWLFEIKHDAALAAVEQREERSAHAPQAAGLVTCGWLDLDHLGAQLRQDHAAGRTHHHVGHLDNPHARKRQFRPGHALLPVQLLFIEAQNKPLRQVWKTYSARTNAWGTAPLPKRPAISTSRGCFSAGRRWTAMLDAAVKALSQLLSPP